MRGNSWPGSIPGPERCRTLALPTFLFDLCIIPTLSVKDNVFLKYVFPADHAAAGAPAYFAERKANNVFPSGGYGGIIATHPIE